nr:hypothetical protein [Tanacetum cinerariifolium]
NSASSSGKKNNSKVSKKVTSSNYLFNTLNTIEESDELGLNGGRKIQMIEGKLVLLGDDGKSLKPSTSTLHSSSNVVYKKVDDLVNEDNDSEVKEVYDETVTYMASMGFNVNKASKSGSGGRNKRLYEQWKKNHGENPYNDDDFES